MKLNINSVKKGLILIAILIVPSLAYLLLSTGKNKFIPLAIYGPKKVDSVLVDGKYRIDTVYHKTLPFSLTDQRGQTITDKDLEGKIYVANFFFATCKSICPKMTGQLQTVQKKFAAMRDLKIVSHTVDPERDTVEALAQYGKQNLVKPGKWFLLTGDKKHIYDLARHSYLVNALQGDGGPEDFIHSELLVLVDKDKRIRGFYDGTNPEEVDRLVDEIKVLKVEYKEKEQ